MIIALKNILDKIIFREGWHLKTNKNEISYDERPELLTVFSIILNIINEMMLGPHNASRDILLKDEPNIYKFFKVLEREISDIDSHFYLI